MDEEDVYRMRHTFCSSLCEDGFEKRDIKDLMGHDNEVTFQTVYAHRLDPEAASKAVADKTNNLFSKRRKTASPRRRSPRIPVWSGGFFVLVFSGQQGPLAQRERVSFTPRRSLVRSQHGPPG